MKLVSPYLTRIAVQENICFTPTFDKDLRTVQQNYVVEGRMGTNSCLPAVAFTGFCHSFGVYFHEAVNSEYFYSLE